MAPKKEREEALNDFSSRIFAAMVEDLVMDVVLQSHQEIARANAVCEICHTRCNSVHVPGSSTSGAGSQTMSNGVKDSSGTETPNGNIYFECSVCKRQIASNRYAPHLSNCMGLGTSRRGAVRNAASKAKMSDAGRSASPYLASESGYVSDENKGSAKGKSKSKAKQADDAEFSLNKKRNGSPSVSPVKKSKKQKTSTTSSPSLHPLSHTNSHSKIPSKLRESSILSSAQIDRRSSSPDSRDSSPDRSVSAQSVLSLQSPILAGAPPPGKGRPNMAAKTPAKRFAPPQPPPPIIKLPDTDYLVDVEGEETGSSTDTESD